MIAVKEQVLNLLKKGEERYVGNADKRRATLFNFLAIGSSIGVIPVVIFVSIINKNDYSLYTTLGLYVFIFSGILLNWKGYNQVAVIGLAILVISINYFVLKIVPYQTGAPYGSLLLALCCLQLIRNRVLRIGFVSAGILSFISFNYVQLKYKEFDDIEFLPVVFVILLMFIALLYYDHLMETFQRQIQDQGRKLLTLEQDKHRKEIDLKQKDLENTLAIFSVKDQVTSQLVERLKETLRDKDAKRSIQRLIVDLQNQNESIRGKALVTKNVEEVNAEFYSRLTSAHPTLTKGDRELCAFLRLNLSNKEIAQLKNTTENTVNVAKARLRKKLDIISNKALVRFLHDF